ncbi:hypothetical protein NR352_27180 [Enterobacter soli]|nr:hypothetical protein [Enterobacter soli]MCR1320586.1 hypothetical protein [Enterobacter soli]
MSDVRFQPNQCVPQPLNVCHVQYRWLTKRCSLFQFSESSQPRVHGSVLNGLHPDECIQQSCLGCSHRDKKCLVD